MAIINISFDTVEKALSVSVDGKSMDNVVEAQVYRNCCSDDDDEFTCSVTTVSRDEVNDMRTMTRIVASESIEGKTISDKLPASIAGFIVAGRTSKVSQDILNFFARG